MKLSQRIQEIEESPLRRFNPMASAAEERGITVHRINIGQPDIPTPPCFMEAIREFQPEVLAYTESQGCEELLSAIQSYYRRNGQQIRDEDITIASGGSEALSMVFTSILDPGDNVVISEPFYTNYATFITAAGGEIHPVTAMAEDGYGFVDEECLRDAIDERTRAILCTLPGNPTGNVLTLKEMELIGKIAEEKDLWIVSDEVYREFCFDRRSEVSFAMLPAYDDRIIIVDSVSKRFSACGARIGSIVCKNPDLNRSVLKLAQGRLCAATLDQMGAAALYRLPEEYYEEVTAEYEKRRDAFYEEVVKIPNIVCQKPGGAFYMMIKLPVDNSQDFLEFMLNDFDHQGETVMFTPAEGFYATPGLGKNEIRIAYVLTAERMKKSAWLLGKGLVAYRERKGV